MIINNELAKWIKKHCENPGSLRLGQAFSNEFIETDVPGLYYEVDDKKSILIIVQWLHDHHYFDCLPPRRS